jgi:hypothetical protein
MDDDDDFFSNDPELIEYLNNNVLWHLWRTTPWHTWPCLVWEMGRTAITWEVMRNHGLIPPNVGLIEDEPEE